MNGFKVADDSVFLYSNGIKTLDRFNDVMEFETHVLEYKGSTEWVEDKIFEIKKVLDTQSIPQTTDDCSTCSYLESVNELENLN